MEEHSGGSIMIWACFSLNQVWMEIKKTTKNVNHLSKKIDFFKENRTNLLFLLNKNVKELSRFFRRSEASICMQVSCNTYSKY